MIWNKASAAATAAPASQLWSFVSNFLSRTLMWSGEEWRVARPKKDFFQTFFASSNFSVKYVKHVHEVLLCICMCSIHVTTPEKLFALFEKKKMFLRWFYFGLVWSKKWEQVFLLSSDFPFFRSWREQKLGCLCGTVGRVAASEISGF